MQKTGVYFSLVTLQEGDKKKDAEIAKQGMQKSADAKASPGAQRSRAGSKNSRSSFKRNTRERVSSRLSRASQPMDFSQSANIVKEAFAEVRNLKKSNTFSKTYKTGINLITSVEYPRLSRKHHQHY